MTETIEEQITVTGTLINVTLFQDKIMRNFLIISNKLRKLEGLMQMEQKQRAMQKEFKFLSMKVDTIVQKLPKDSGSLSKNDARSIAKEAFFDILNAGDEKLSKSKFNQDIMAEIKTLKDNLSNLFGGSKDQRKKKQSLRTSFTAGQILRESEKQKQKSRQRQEEQDIKIPKESLQDVLDEKEMEMVSQIVQKKVQDEQPSVTDLSIKLEELSKVVEQLRLGRGYSSYLERQAEKFQRFQQYEEKNRQTAKRQKDKPIQLQGIKVENVKGQLLKNGLLNEVQRMELNKEQIAKQELMQRKTIYGGLPKQTKRQSKEFRDVKDSTGGFKQRDPFVSTLRSDDKQKQGFKRSHSIRKLQKIDRRIRLDDLKELNSILRQIQLRIESKLSHDIFMGFVKGFEEKLQTIRYAKDSTAQVNQIRKNIFVLQSKVQSVVAYLQSISQQDEALVVRKQWTCVSCDKGIEKYQGKVGQHLNWDSVASKKLSPTKVGAFGQTGQLAAKIRNLMDGNEGEE